MLARSPILAIGMLLLAAVRALAPACAQCSVADGPIVLHSNVAWQWGGHTFSYLLQGEKYLFWGALAGERTPGPTQEEHWYYVKDKYMTYLVGQYPLPGTGGGPSVHTITLEPGDITSGPPPLLWRSPDGYLHMIIAPYRYQADRPRQGVIGTLRYYRSARPEDVTEWVDRTDCIPTTPYGEFHLRMNVGVSQDGSRAVIAVLGTSEDNSVPGNTPLVFYGRRDGLDYRFEPGIKYAEPMGFFYPQVAVLQEGVVLLGELWDEYERPTGLLVHLDWEGKLLHREMLPSSAAPGSYYPTDMRPESDEDWNRLIIYQNWAPKSGPWRHCFLRYDAQTRQLEPLAQIVSQYSEANPGKWLPVGPGRSLFVNNPSMAGLRIWDGDILAGGPFIAVAPQRLNPCLIGYRATSYVMTSNPLQGSLMNPDERYLMTDVYNANNTTSERAPCSLLLWGLRANPH